MSNSVIEHQLDNPELFTPWEYPYAAVYSMENNTPRLEAELQHFHSCADIMLLVAEKILNAHNSEPRPLRATPRRFRFIRSMLKEGSPND